MLCIYLYIYIYAYVPSAPAIVIRIRFVLVPHECGTKLSFIICSCLMGFLFPNRPNTFDCNPLLGSASSIFFLHLDIPSNVKRVAGKQQTTLVLRIKIIEPKDCMFQNIKFRHSMATGYL